MHRDDLKYFPLLLCYLELFHIDDVEPCDPTSSFKIPTIKWLTSKYNSTFPRRVKYRFFQRRNRRNPFLYKYPSIHNWLRKLDAQSTLMLLTSVDVVDNTSIPLITILLSVLHPLSIWSDQNPGFNTSRKDVRILLFCTLFVVDCNPCWYGKYECVLLSLSITLPSFPIIIVEAFILLLLIPMSKLIITQELDEWEKSIFKKHLHYY